jgi:hypothetical protein
MGRGKDYVSLTSHYLLYMGLITLYFFAGFSVVKSMPLAQEKPGSEDMTPAVRSKIDYLMEKAAVALIARRYIEPANDNVLVFTQQVLRLDKGHKAASMLQEHAVEEVKKEANEAKNNNNYQKAIFLYSELLNYFPDNAAIKAELDDIKKRSVQYQDRSRAKKFKIIHYGTGSSDWHCTGTLYVFRDSVLYDGTIRHGINAIGNDLFEIPFNNVQQVKKVQGLADTRSSWLKRMATREAHPEERTDKWKYKKTNAITIDLKNGKSYDLACLLDVGRVSDCDQEALLKLFPSELVK